MPAADVCKIVDVYAANKLIERYGKNGDVGMARVVFDSLGDSRRDIFSWHLLLLSHARNGNIREARGVFDSMPGWDMPTWNVLLTAFAREGDILLAESLFSSMPEKNLISWTALLTAYAQGLHIDKANLIFIKMPQHNLISWTAVLTANSQAGDIYSSEYIFRTMPERDLVSWNAMLAAFSAKGDLKRFNIVFKKMPQHDLVSWTTKVAMNAHSGHSIEGPKRAFDKSPQHNLVSYNAMLSAYSLHGYVDDAEILFFHSMPEANLVSWNTMLAVYTHNDHTTKALDFFHSIPLHDQVSFTLVISLLGDMALETRQSSRDLLDQAREMFETAMPDHSLIACNAMLSAYARNGHLEQARFIFSQLPDRDLVAWNSMLSALLMRSGGGLLLDEVKQTYDQMPSRSLVSNTMLLDAYVQSGCFESAKNFFDERMPQHNTAAWNAMLSAYAHNHYLLQTEALLAQMPEANIVSWNTLLFAYAQDGRIAKAKKFFDRMPEWSVVSWGSMLATLVTSTKNKQDDEKDAAAVSKLTVTNLLPWMHLSSVAPDKVCFVSALVWCNHEGSVYSGRSCFLSMQSDFGIKPNKRHFSCLLDLLVRAGYVAQACSLLSSMPFVPDVVDWVCVLGSLGSSSNKSRNAAKELFEKVVHPEAIDGAANVYVLLSNMYVLSNQY